MNGSQKVRLQGKGGDEPTLGIRKGFLAAYSTNLPILRSLGASSYNQINSRAGSEQGRRVEGRRRREGRREA